MPSRRSGRAAAKKAAAALESTPKGFADVEDEPMPDADAAEDNASEHEEPPAHDDDDDDDGEHQEPKGDESGDDDAKDEESAKEPTPPPQPVIRRKRLGRPPKNKPPDWDPMVTVTEDTPRRRGRGGWRGRGGRKGGPAAPKAEQVIDAEGTVAEIVNDECVLPEDLEGETKVDKQGNLDGGREYRCRTFTVLGRGNRLYMLSTEPARCVGFRDSYLFFTKHRKLYKIIVDDDEKRDMIEREIIPHSYKGRSIGVVTARSVFREFGARIVVGGKRIVDDYGVAQARADGVVEGQLADPDDHFIPGEPYNKNQYVAWHGASAVYHTNVPTVPVPSGKPEYKKRKVNVNDQNWMLEHAREASIFNASINAIRKLNNGGVYDIHTNVIQYPAIMQPTLARIELVAPEDEVEAKGSERFPPVSSKLARNFFVTDTYYESAPAGAAPAASDKADSADFLASFNGLKAVSDDIKDLLPPECRKAFEKAALQDGEWKSRWAAESEKTSRRDPVIDKAIVPYSMN
ncbi:Chromatin structure-remodeling complex subunit rsc7 [Tolypocladium ophioglossoides CBS 100239]|uniref:Chromatin structure-remodeling complex subunit rsc7 n=1 Tax=Tolypocladium ophioglossoides (strain CBS 100239) TaxID=1163406 RepID=A0A0L0N7Y2_TOLOC|nr:Chromatin structure-remodeling complex subunit rsc7 [Tolypocladium ophioglossoides CBS 100239]